MTIETVTADNLAEFNAARTRTTPEPEAKPEVKEPTEEVKATAEPEKVDDPTDDEPKEPKKGNHKLENRFAELTEKRRAAEERATAAEARAAAAEAKLAPKPTEPPVDSDIGPEPKSKDYTDAFDYAKDLAEWSTNKALKERDKQDAAKEQAKEHAKIVDGWKGRIAVVKAELPDYDDMIASSEVKVSDPVRDALIENEHGPRILYDLAADPDLADKLGKMSILRQVVEIGRMAAKYDKAAEKEEKEEVIIKERPKAPAPITPVKGTRKADSINDPGEFQGSYAQYKAQRLAQMR